MKLEIEKRIFEVFPDAKIGWLLAEVKIEPSNEYVESMKKGLIGRLKDIGISQDTMMLHPDVAGWREVYSKMGLNPVSTDRRWKPCFGGRSRETYGACRTW